MTIRFDKPTYSRLHDALQHAFPDAQVQDGDVEALAVALHDSRIVPDVSKPAQLRTLDLSAWSRQLDALATSKLSAGSVQLKASRINGLGALRYYWAEATHSRLRPGGYAPFVGQLPMVRVSLPAQSPQNFATAIGTVEPADHMIATVAEANEKYARDIGYALQRVDLITPPRHLLRFAAVSIYLGYDSLNGRPTCFVLEAGTATGQAKVTFLGKTISTSIDRVSGYQPTPFSCSDNAYTGQLTLAADSPAQLQVTARKIINGQSTQPYIRIQVQFNEELTSIRDIWPGLLIARAALIVLERQENGLPPGCDKTELPA